MATKRMDESWFRIKSQIESMFGEMDEKELKKARGNFRKMVSLIHEKTGEDERSIMQKMSAIV
ncbi:MAG: general stress protein CsbD [Bacteroidota bacterium]